MTPPDSDRTGEAGSPGAPVPDPAALEGLNAVLESVPFEFFRANRCLPLSVPPEGPLRVAVPDTAFDRQLLDNLSLRLGRTVESESWPEERIRRALRRLEHELLARRDQRFDRLPEEILTDFRDQVRDRRQRLDSSEEAPIAGRINSLIADAVLNEASDIHFEPGEEQVRVRYRERGVLRDVLTFPLEILPGIVSRVKVMAGLDIAQQHVPQDGRINLDVGDRKIDVRVSIVPTVYGERVVLRILDRATLKHTLPELGMTEPQVGTVGELIRGTDGIVLVTGPTGSGKTTSLYCFLRQIRERRLNIITLEDPVEYRLKEINQVEVRPEGGLSFAQGLRSVLRQDPDVIMVGEIRDHESARLALHASLTGHLVFATLHTRHAVGALSRLIDLGLDPHLIGAGLEAVIAQRLVRTFCPRCDRPEEASSDCGDCQGSGFAGRVGIFEILRMDSALAAVLENDGGPQQLREALDENSFTPLREQAERLVRQGLTSRVECSRVLEMRGG